jgi:XTP/dITP diphosphohydrolase
MFQPDGLSQTFAELSAQAKNAISHRGKAVAAMLDKCFT